MQALIEVDLPEEVLSDFEPISFRTPQNGEFFWNDHTKTVDDGHDGMRFSWLVLRPRFKWPAWLKCRYLVWTADGDAIGWCGQRPHFNGLCWTGQMPGHLLQRNAIDLPFPGGDWRTRVEENPNWGK